jgi:hypothetical protein
VGKHVSTNAPGTLGTQYLGADASSTVGEYVSTDAPGTLELG